MDRTQLFSDAIDEYFDGRPNGCESDDSDSEDFHWNDKNAEKFFFNGGNVSFILNKYGIEGDINTLKDSNGYTLLMWILTRDYIPESLQRFLDIPGLILPYNIIQTVFRTFEFEYTDESMIGNFSLLISNGAQIDAMDQMGWTVLVASIYSESYLPDFVKMLVDSGSDVNTTCKQGRTPLMHAARKENISALEILLNTPGVKINAKCYAEYTAIMYAIVVDSEEGCDALLNAGAKIRSVDSDGNTALHFATRIHSIVNGPCFRNINIGVNLILRGANLYAKNSSGKTPLDVFGKFYDANGTEEDIEEEDSEEDKQEFDKQRRLLLGAHEVYRQRVRDENWASRWPLMDVLTSSGILKMARHLAADAISQDASDKSIKLQGILRNTPQANRMYLIGAVLGDIYLLKIIAAYLCREDDESDDEEYDDDFDEEKGHWCTDISSGD